MNKNYKLLGVIWDHRPVSDKILDTDVIKDEKELPYVYDSVGIQDYKKKRNLFDLRIYRRKVNLSEILQKESITDVDEIIYSLRNCDEVYLHIDYIPKCESRTVRVFFLKRLNQIYAYIREKLRKEIQLFILVDDPENKLLECHYSETRHFCL